MPRPPGKNANTADAFDARSWASSAEKSIWPSPVYTSAATFPL